MPRPVFAALAPYLDGGSAVEDIFEALSGSYESGDVYSALTRLRRDGYLAEDTANLPRSLRSFWEHTGAFPGDAQSRLASTEVTTRGLGGISKDTLDSLLEQQGVGLGTGKDLTVILTENYLHPDLDSWNEGALKSGQPWVLARPTGIETWLGPAFVPGRTACWECLAHRLRWHRRMEEYVGHCKGQSGFSGGPAAALPASGVAALAELSTEIARWIGSGSAPVLADQVITTNVQTLERSHHRLIQRPQCPACGSAAPLDGTSARPIALRTTPKVDTTDGGHRGSDQTTVIASLERHLSPITGIIGTLRIGDRTQKSDSKNAPTVTYSADHNFSDMHDNRFFLREGLRRRSGGKGKSAQQARASALGESLERYSGVFDGTEPRLRATYLELGNAALNPNSCMCYSKAQYADRGIHNRKAHKAHWVPEPFREDAAIEWTPLWSLTNLKTRYLPTSFCYFGYPNADPIFARADSNGCAAGSSVEEAILQGLLELIERDAVAIWWYNRLQLPGVDLSNTQDAYVSGLIDHYRGLHREVWALDLTSDFGIPIFAALSRRTDKPEEDIIYGFGCHLDPSVALSRALTELNQSLEAVPAANGPASARTYRGDVESVDWWHSVRVRQTPYLLPDPEVEPRSLNDIADRSSEDIRQDIEFCVSTAKSLDIEVLVLDQTRPDVELPVVRVVAPGLRHFWGRFGPGRLYDVPVKEGWLTNQIKESDLNPAVVQF
ncbi:MAG: TOMM precursor leader peptide-binding protein [Paracoccaceae bacterium]